MRKLLVLPILAIFSVGFLLTPTAVQAQWMAEETLTVEENSSENIYVAAEEFILNGNSEQDVVAAAGRLVINGDVSGNLIVAGGEVEVNGAVVGDVLAAGGNVVVNGPISGDLRLVGGQVYVNSEDIYGDLIVAGGSVSISEDTVVRGQRKIQGGALTFDSTQNPTTLSEIVGSNSQFEGLSESLEGIAVVASIIGFVFGLLALVGTVIANYLVIRFFPVLTENTLVTMKENALYSILVGIGLFIFAPILGFILLISGVGIPVLGVLAALASVAYIFAGAYSNYMVGRLILVQLNFENTGRLLPLITGTVLIGILKLIPVIGFVFAFLGDIVLPAWGVGALAMNKWVDVREMETKKPSKKKK